MSKITSRASKRQRRSREQWQALLARFESAGLRVASFCANESISEASFYRWKGLLASSRAGQDIAQAVGFVDLGAMASGAREARLELRLDLGGGVVLHLVRG
jgi:hypothetical protein